MSIGARLEKLQDRERKLLLALGVVAAALVLIGAPAGIYAMVSGKRAENEELRAAIAAVEDARANMSERKARHDALLTKYASPAPALGGFIEQAAKSHSLTIADTQDKPDTPHGKKYNEKFTTVKMHKIGLKAFVEMLQQIETSAHPVAVTRLNIKPRAGEPDQYEVELGVSSYERKSDKAEKGDKDKGDKDKGDSGRASPSAEPEEQQ